MKSRFVKQTQGYALSLFLISLLVFSACTSSVEPQSDIIVLGDGTYIEATLDLSKDGAIKQFASEEEFLAYIGSQRQSYGGSGFSRNTFATESMAVKQVTDSVSGDSSSAPASAPNLDYSTTNIQVAGVDEADLLKTDGNYIYTVTENMLFIIQAYPGEDANVVAEIELPGHGANLFVKDNILAVFGTESSSTYSDVLGYIPSHQMSYLHMYDITDKERPQQIETYSFEGNYHTAREQDGQIYLVLRLYPEVRPGYPMPIYYEGDMLRSVSIDSMYYLPSPHSRGVETVVVHSLPFQEGARVESVSLTGNYVSTVYMSNTHMYLVSSEYINEYDLQQNILQDMLKPRLSQEDLVLIEKIKKTDNEVLTQAEKEQKIMNVYYMYLTRLTEVELTNLETEVETELLRVLDTFDYFEYAVISKISITDLEVLATSKVPGSLVNQFSLDEYEENLRVATTINQRWSRYAKQQDVSTNNVWVLDDQLNQIGSLNGLAEDESIYATRFIADRLYMVTFKQIDPFFVIDLSNPKNPVNLGELKIPGFSRYLHPYDENHIIGIGQEASETGRVLGLKISLFNVADVANPIEVAKYVTESRYANSQALYEHKAFLFSKERNLLVIPAYSYSWDNRGESYNGAFVFSISPEEISLRGLIDHSSGSESNWYSPSVERSLYIEDLLYTKSPYLLRINALDTLEGVKDVQLQVKNTKIPIY